MGTKIKSHRIGDEAVLLKHLSKSIRIPESLLSLNYKTHSNEADLEVGQKNILTQGGNADTLHYHTGGGGGRQGIYTNEERDAQLLKLSMMVNADIFGLDKAIVDNFNDDSGIYKGYRHAKAPTLTNITDDTTYTGSLKGNQEYSYGISYKNQYGQTNVVNVGSIITANAVNNAVNIELNDVPSDNKGLSIYRTDGSMEISLKDEEDGRWVNPFCMPYNTLASDKTTGLSSTAFTFEYCREEYPQYITYAMPLAPGSPVALGSTPSVNVPFDYFLVNINRTSPYELEILWDRTDAFAPRDYEVYYTTDKQITDFEKANWQKFSILEKQHVGYNIPARCATDGTIVDSYKIVNNTRPENKFYINPVEGITYLRIRVLRIDNLCRLTRVNLVDSQKTYSKRFFLDTSDIDFTQFNAIKFDYKFTGSMPSVTMEATLPNESISSTSYFYDVTPASFSSTHKEIKDGYTLATTTYSRTINPYSYNRVRIGLRIASGSDFFAENFYLRFSANNSYSSSNIECLDYYNIPVTFDGKPYLQSNESGAKEVWSDWVYLPNDKSTTMYTPMLLFKQVRGTLMYYSSGGYVWHSVTDDALGKEGRADYNFSSDGYSSRMIFTVQFGRGDSITKRVGVYESTNKWQKGYFDISNVKSIKHLMFYLSSTNCNNSVLSLDNFTATRNKNIIAPDLSITYKISSGSVTLSSIDSFAFERRRVVSFNQYATTENPQFVCFEFSTLQTIGQINMLCNSQGRTPANYVLQFASDDSATYDEPLDSMNWSNFSNLRIGESGFDVGFTGEIIGSRVIANNLYATTIAHRFDAADVKKVRIWIEGTIGGVIPYIDDIRIYSAVDAEDMKLIFDTSSKTSYPKFTLVDDGITPKNITTPKYNTTGSYNILWNKYKKLVEVIDKSDDAVLYTNIIQLSLFKDFMVTAQELGGVLFEASFDDGATFVPIELDVVNSIATQSDSVVIKAILKDKATLHAFAMLYSL